MKDIPDLLDGLRRSPNILTAFVGCIADDQLDRRRGDGFWTIAEHLSHLAQIQPMLLERLQRFRDQPHPLFVPYIPGEGEDEPATPEVIPPRRRSNSSPAIGRRRSIYWLKRPPTFGRRQVIIRNTPNTRFISCPVIS